MIVIDTGYAVQNYHKNSSINLVPSAVLSVFYFDKVIHLTIDNGCAGNIIRLNVVENMNIDIKPIEVKAKLADDKIFLLVNLQQTCSDMRKVVAHIKARTVPRSKEKSIRDACYYIQHCKVDKDGLFVHEKQVLLEPQARLLIVVLKLI